jgi:hypothetical protein
VETTWLVGVLYLSLESLVIWQFSREQTRRVENCWFVALQVGWPTTSTLGKRKQVALGSLLDYVQ